MADKTEATPAKSEKAKAVEKLVKKAEELLVPTAAGYDATAADYNRGVQAVLDLLRAEL